MTTEIATPSRLNPVLLEFSRAQFKDGLQHAVEIGGLLAIRWLIHREESRFHSDDQSNLLPLAKLIEARWTTIECEFGEGSLLVEEAVAALQIFYGPHTTTRYSRKPHLVENARRLRRIKDPEWWQLEHQLGSLADAVRFGGPV